MCSWNFDFDSFLPGEDTDQNWASWAAPLILLASMVVSCRDGLSLWTLQLGTESGLILQIFQLYQQIPMGFKMCLRCFKIFKLFMVQDGWFSDLSAQKLTKTDMAGSGEFQYQGDPGFFPGGIAQNRKLRAAPKC